MNTLLIQSSARHEDSVSRRLAVAAAERLGGALTLRDLAESAPPFLDAGFVRATFIPPENRDAADRAALAASDALVAELKAADIVVIGTPIYNFGVPAALKTWFDQIARPGETFRYTQSGPVGLLTGKRAVVVAATGGVKIGSDADFATSWLRFALGFLGVDDVEIIAAETLNAAPENAESAAAEIAALAA